MVNYNAIYGTEISAYENGRIFNEGIRKRWAERNELCLRCNLNWCDRSGVCDRCKERD